MHPDIHLRLASERMAALERAAADARLARSAGRPVAKPRPDDMAHVTLRLDRVSDTVALEQLAALSECRLPPGPFVVSEVDGRVVAAIPLPGGRPLADPFVATAHLLPLLELRAAQIRRVEVRPRLRRRLLPRRA
jgi:hypothetical protein